MADNKRGLLGFTGKEIRNPIKAIRAYCLGCSHTPAQVADCGVPYCELFPYRFGTNPYRAERVLTEEERKAITERLKTARNQKENYTSESGV